MFQYSIKEDSLYSQKMLLNFNYIQLNLAIQCIYKMCLGLLSNRTRNSRKKSLYNEIWNFDCPGFLIPNYQYYLALPS